MGRRAIIVGAGIGGLSAAVALAQRRWEVRVLEQAPELREVGAGLQISPNGTKVLDALGVLDDLRPLLFEPETVELRLGRSGRKVFSIPMRRIATERWGAGYYQVHRADLADALRRRLVGLQPDAMRTGVQVSGYRQSGDRIVAGTDQGESAPGDVLVGADGIRSTIRAQMLGAEAPRFTGNVAWRAVVPAERLSGMEPPRAGCIWAGDRRHAVTTWLRGGTLVNFVGIVEQAGWYEEGWSHPGDPAQARADFAGWHPVIRRVLAEAGEMHRWALFDRPPLPRWSDGRAVLLGDACHPMLPSMAQGAVQALEDAWVLAEMLHTAPDAADAAARYFAARIGRVSAIQRRSAMNAGLFHLPNAALRFMAYAPLWTADRIAPGLLWRMQDRIYRHDVVDG